MITKIRRDAIASKEEQSLQSGIALIMDYSFQSTAINRFPYKNRSEFVTDSDLCRFYRFVSLSARPDFFQINYFNAAHLAGFLNPPFFNGFPYTL